MAIVVSSDAEVLLSIKHTTYEFHTSGMEVRTWDRTYVTVCYFPAEATKELGMSYRKPASGTSPTIPSSAVNVA